MLQQPGPQEPTMAHVTIGTGNMGQAIAGVVAA
jgi:hypothetical protein